MVKTKNNPLELYAVTLPEYIGFDYEGILPELSGTVMAKNERGAIRSFFERGQKQKGEKLYDKFKIKVDDQTERFAKKATRFVAEYYALKYTSNSQYDSRLTIILEQMNVPIGGLSYIDLIDALEVHYRNKYDNFSDRRRQLLRSLCSTVFDQIQIISDDYM